MRIVGRAPHNCSERAAPGGSRLRLRPDLIIVDITMPLLNLRRRNPEKEEPTRLAYRSPASTAELTKHAIEHDRGGEPGVISGLIWVAVETVDPSGAIL